MIRHTQATASHVGQIRDINQDRSLVTDTVAAVADGMGGHVAGEQAAALAIAELSGVKGEISADRLARLARSANDRVYRAGSDPTLRGMGTTLVAIVVDDVKERAAIINVGDSRAYRFRRRKLEQLTVDHSLVEDLVREGRLTRKEAKDHPQRNIVTRALGISEEIQVDSFDVDARPGDRFLLASDGLFNEVNDAGMIEILSRPLTADEAAQELVAAAVKRGGRDNVTVALVDVFDAFDLTGEGTVREDSDDTAETDVAERVGPDTETLDPVVLDELTTPDSDTDSDTESDQRPQAEKADPVPGDPDFVDRRAPQPKKRRWPKLLAGFVLIAIVAGALLTTRWYAQSAWFADEADGNVAVFQGRPDGVLWWEPDVVDVTDLKVDELDPVSRERLNARPSWSSLDDATEFVASLDRLADEPSDSSSGN